MENFYLPRWLKEEGGLDPETVDALKYELDKRIYYYGAQFAYPQERTYLERRYRGLKTLVRGAAARLKPFRKGGRAALRRVSSNAYFNLNTELEAAGFAAEGAPWTLSRAELGDEKLSRQIDYLKKAFELADFRTLVSPAFLERVRAFKAALMEFYRRRNYAALVVPFDMPFFERCAIAAFRELGRPSFVALHGLPGRYNAVDDNRADYLLVWGDRIKELYVKAGVRPEKIFVTGRPGFAAPPPAAPRLTAEDVLVISKSMNGSQHSGEEILTDRGNLPLYLLSVRKGLEAAGVKRARLRLHPSESAAWYKSFLGGDFYIFDTEPLAASLKRATLVVGPTSTVFIEALMAGVSYLVYEPAVGGRDLTNYPLVPPFDGSEPGAPRAGTPEELAEFIAAEKTALPAALAPYLKTPFDLGPALAALKGGA
ncbi:MAG: hypothetical protein A2089_11470 [Elusimicrobia bacterium GWD2_63_28]|nr:MAG: hypothetical protein A2089_11470 [Elusimicrobia bacterium GWD2_63_28]